MKRAAAMASACVVAAATAALAQPAADEAIALTWRAPPECPTQAAVRDQIDRLLGGPPSPANHKRLVADADVDKAADGTYRVRIRTNLGGVRGERSLDAPSCEALADAAALVVALTFDPEAVAAHREAASAPPTTAAPPPKAPPGPAPSPKPEPQRTGRPRFALAALASGSIGPLPGLAYGVGGRAALLAPRLRVEVGGTVWPNERATLADSRGGDFHLVAATAHGCFVPLERAIELGACAELEIGRMAGSGFGVANLGEGAALWLAPGAEALAAVPIGRFFAIRAEVGALVPLFRHDFVLTLESGTTESVHRPAPVAGIAALGLELRL